MLVFVQWSSNQLEVFFFDINLHMEMADTWEALQGLSEKGRGLLSSLFYIWTLYKPSSEQQTCPTLMCLTFEHLKTIDFPFEANGKLMLLGVSILMHFGVFYIQRFSAAA